MSEYISMWKRCFDFSGRSTRKEYWMAYLINIIIIFILSFISQTGIDLITIYGLLIILPTLSLFIRRMHDINRSGWWIFGGLIPFVGWIIVLVFLCTRSIDENNSY
ncbi:MAG: DUF805 domain-containing protein [Clostridia bacterium]|nr:DUF805 domain-containing protein [Clostridia bacterium]